MSWTLQPIKIRKIIKYLTVSSTMTIVQPPIISRLCYFNSIAIYSKENIYVRVCHVITSSIILIYNLNRNGHIIVKNMLNCHRWFNHDNMITFKVL